MWYLQSAFDTYHKVQDTLQSRLEEVRAAATSPLHLVTSLLSTGAPAESGGEVEQLRRRVAELEARLQKGHK